MIIRDENSGRLIERNGIFEIWRNEATGEKVLFAVFPVVNGRMTNPVKQVTHDKVGNKIEWEAQYELPPFWEKQVEIGATALKAASMKQAQRVRPFDDFLRNAGAPMLPWLTPAKFWLLALLLAVDALLVFLWWLR